MNRLFFLLLLMLPLWVAASEMPSLDSAPVDVYDQASLRRGARVYADYCQGCHSLKYMRYSRLARDMGLSEVEVVKQFLQGVGSAGDTMRTSMTAESGVNWFGVAPPDLSLTVRARGADWVYTYLRSFYLDSSRPTGVNNLLFKDVAMPNVLGELQGQQERIGLDHKTNQLKLIRPGRLGEDEFDEIVGDLTNFMAYVAEPAQLDRSRVGKYVLIFLVVMLVVFYQLKKEYWRDID